MDNFISDSMRTESSLFNKLVDKQGKQYDHTRLIHAQMGMQTETAEFTDALKKSIFYGRPLDTTNLKEELGDLMWYMAIAMDELGTDFQTESDRVIAKLKARYPEKFTTDNAEHRNLANERIILESNEKMTAGKTKTGCPKDEHGKLMKPANFPESQPKLQELLDARIN